MSETREEAIERLTRDRDAAFAEWARVSSPNYRPRLWTDPVALGELSALAIGAGLLLALFGHFAGGEPFLPATGAYSAIAFACALIGWYTRDLA